MSKAELISAGTPVIAVTNVGPVREGEVGFVTGSAELGPFFWKRHFYLCTFFGNVKVAVRPKEIDAYDHGRTFAEIERGVDPNASTGEQMLQIRPLRDTAEQRRRDFVKRAENIGGTFQHELARSSLSALAHRFGEERAILLAAAIANYVCRFGFVNPDHANDAELMASFEEARRHVFANLEDTFKSNATGALILLAAAWNVPLEKFKDHLTQLAAEDFAKVGSETPDVRRELPEEFHLYMATAAVLGR